MTEFLACRCHKVLQLCLLFHQLLLELAWESFSFGRSEMNEIICDPLDYFVHRRVTGHDYYGYRRQEVRRWPPPCHYSARIQVDQSNVRS